MALDFPLNPVNGQTYGNYYYDSIKGIWRSLFRPAVPNLLESPTINNAVITATAPNATTVPLTVNGATSQSANLQEWKNSSGSVLSSVSSSGKINANSIETLSLHLSRQNTASEGGQVNFKRAIDNVDSWYIDAYGSTTTPNFRILNDSYTPVEVSYGGIVTTPYQPRFFANRSADFTGYNPSNQSNVIIYNSVSYNIGNYYNASTGKFTAPVSGIYSFTVGSYQSVNVSQLWPVINGARAESFVATATSNNWAGSFTRYLNANDNIGILAWSDGNTNVTVYANWYHTYFSGYLVG